MRNVSIIMPCYNSEKFLPETLNSIVTQTYPQWNLFIVNDGSTDRSMEIIQNFVKALGSDQIRVFSGPNQGVSAARNFLRGLILNDRRSDLIAFCDSDDIWMPMHLWKSVYYFDSHSDADFLYSDVKCRFADGNPAFSYGIPYYDVFDINNLKDGNFIYLSTVMFKKKCFDVGEFSSEVNGREDHLLWLKMAMFGYKFYHLKEVLTTYVDKVDGVASTWNSEKQVIFNRKVKEWELNCVNIVEK